MKKIFTTALKWLIPICGVTVAVLGVITGQFNLAIWALLAAAFSWMTDEFRELSDHAIEYGDAMMLENLKMSSELCDAKLKIHDLQKEIKRLQRDEKM